MKLWVVGNSNALKPRTAFNLVGISIGVGIKISMSVNCVDDNGFGEKVN